MWAEIEQFTITLDTVKSANFLAPPPIFSDTLGFSFLIIFKTYFS